jgi:hypothetical protein
MAQASVIKSKLNKALKILSQNENRKKQYIFFDKENWSITIKDKKDETIRYLTMDDAPTAKEYMYDFESKELGIMGSRGSAKSTASIDKILWIAFLNPPCIDGVKKSRFSVSRDTFENLMNTTWETIVDWIGFEEIGFKPSLHPTPTITLDFFDGQCRNKIELLFLSYNRAEKASKAESLELTGAYFNELRHIPIDAYYKTSGSVGRYPSIKERGAGEYISQILFDTNAFDKNHILYEIFVKDEWQNMVGKFPQKEAGLAFYRQEGGLIESDDGNFIANERADNIKNLPKDFYKNMAIGKPREFILSQICNKFGDDLSGERVHPEYDPTLHSCEFLEIRRDAPISIFWDYGGVNACLVVQFYNGVLFVIKELIGVKTGLRNFCKNTVKVYLDENNLNLIAFFEGDCADNYSHESSMSSSDIVFEELGRKPTMAVTNDIPTRIAAVDRLILKEAYKGQRGLMVSRTGCPKLHEGLSKRYTLKLEKGADNTPVLKPNKNTIYSHPADCLQYAALRIKTLEKESRDNSLDRAPVPGAGYSVHGYL